MNIIISVATLLINPFSFAARTEGISVGLVLVFGV
jgi:hypothetical protein